VFAVLNDYRRTLDALEVDQTTALLTSAVRDAANGEEFTQSVRDRYGLHARTIPGSEEAALTFLGATSEREDGDGEVVVIDIGGGSTEVVVGRGRDVSFFVSMQIGVVRQTERHIDNDPPEHDELVELAEEVRSIVEEEVPADIRERVNAAIAVAGTATSAAAIDQALEPYDPAKTHGHRIDRARLDELLSRLAQMDNAERRDVAGLHPDRAPTIVAGMVVLIEVLRAFGLESVEVSEHDILRGGALKLVA
jgi:exopolyphosphatase/guanosine-5'-triphosphate,3'-diphosphate pyrophosphatase